MNQDDHRSRTHPTPDPGLAGVPGPVFREVSSSSYSLIEEIPVAFVYAGKTLAVMMATPADLLDFAVGLSLTEGITSRPLPDTSIESVAHASGIELRIRLVAGDRRRFQHRLRASITPSSCGLCGLRSLAQVVPAPPDVGGLALRLPPALLNDSVEQLRTLQPLHDRTHSAHAAAFMVPGRGIITVREDIGRHNALDKLAGALARAGEVASTGAIVLTSRVSVEMVQKAAAMGAPAIIAVSAPSALGVRVAKAAGITLVGSVRHGHHQVHTHHYRIDARPAPRHCHGEALQQDQETLA